MRGSSRKPAPRLPKSSGTTPCDRARRAGVARHAAPRPAAHATGPPRRCSDLRPRHPRRPGPAARRASGAARSHRARPRDRAAGGRSRAGARSARGGRVRHLRLRGPGRGRRGGAGALRGAGGGGGRLSGLLERRPGLLVLVDPSRSAPPQAAALARAARDAGAAGVLIGSSFDGTQGTHLAARAIRAAAPELPLVLFPGSALQLTDQVDLVLFLSLISGRNPQYLIEEHVRAVPFLTRHPVPTLSTGYILIDGGRVTSVEAVSQTRPLPADKPELAAAHATAARLIGMQAIYLDAGSGAPRPVAGDVIAACRAAIPGLTLFVGGGIRTPQQGGAARAAGADFVVVGTALEGRGATELAADLQALVRAVAG